MVAASYGGGVKVLFGENWPYSASTKDLFEGADSFEKDRASEDVAENGVFTMERGFVEYKIGPGDVLEITLWEPSGVTREEVEVMPDGHTVVCVVEDLRRGRLTAKELDIMLTEKAGRIYQVPEGNGDSRSLMSKWVSVLDLAGRNTQVPDGEAIKAVGGGATISTARCPSWSFCQESVSLPMPLERGPRNAKKWPNQKTQRLQGDDLGRQEQDIVLDSGDSIYVSVVSQEGNRVFVFGEVGSPGAYTFSGSGIRLMDAIASAGGPDRVRPPGGDASRQRRHHQSGNHRNRHRSVDGNRRPDTEHPVAGRRPGLRASVGFREHQLVRRSDKPHLKTDLRTCERDHIF